MFGLITIALIAVAANGHVTKSDKLSMDYTFEKFISEHHLSFPSSELSMRKELFAKELKRVVAHNAKNLSWKEGMNKFSVLTPQEKKGTLGRSKNVKQAVKKDNKFKSSYNHLESKPVSALPKHVDWRAKGVVSAVKDQGHCGSCWAFASTEVIESAVALSTGLLFDLSPEQIAMCAPNPDSCGGTGGCSGATAEIAFDYISKSDGLYEEFQYPYNSYDGTDMSCQTTKVSSITAPKAIIDGYVQLPSNNYTALMNAVATFGPIAISVDASVWHTYESGVFDGCNQKNPDLDHAVVLVGYGEEAGQKYWLVRNSWSASYGEAGYIKVLRTDDEEERCGTDNTPQDGTACAGDTEPQHVCGTCGILFDSAYVTGAATA